MRAKYSGIVKIFIDPVGFICGSRSIKAQASLTMLNMKLLELVLLSSSFAQKRDGLHLIELFYLFVFYLFSHRHKKNAHTYAETNSINFSYIYPYVNTEAPSHTSSFVIHMEDTVTLLPTLRSHDHSPNMGGVPKTGQEVIS